jgi:hypothetical protein
MIYKISRTDSVGYDEYDAFVVRAASPSDALELCDNSDFKADNTEIELLSEHGIVEIVLGSFNAG